MITKRKMINAPNFAQQSANADAMIDVIVDSITPILEKAGEIVTYGADLLTEAIAEPTLDRYLDRSPKVGQPINYEELVGVLHRKRAAFITAEQKKKEPKIDGEDNEA